MMKMSDALKTWLEDPHLFMLTCLKLREVAMLDFMNNTLCGIKSKTVIKWI